MRDGEIGVLTIDIERSREVENRNALQMKLKKTIETVNAEYGKHIISGFSITRGDEFQGALRDLELFYEIFSYFEHLLHPIKVKGGFGVGTLSTSVSKNISEMDGPAFHRSREAIEAAEKSKNQIQIKSEREISDRIINVILDLIGSIKEGWTKRQREITWHVSKEKTTIVQAAKDFSVTKQNISQILENSSYKSIRKAEDAVKTLMKEYQAVEVDKKK